jgi:hypothetical protein
VNHGITRVVLHLQDQNRVVESSGDAVKGQIARVAAGEQTTVAVPVHLALKGHPKIWMRAGLMSSRAMELCTAKLHMLAKLQRMLAKS